jgi:hypothetical protein
MKKKKKTDDNGDDKDRVSCVCVIYFCYLSLALRAIFNLMNDVSTTVQANIDLAWSTASKIRQCFYCTTHTHIHIYVCSHRCHRSGQRHYLYCKKKGRTSFSLYFHTRVYVMIYTHLSRTMHACMSSFSLFFFLSLWVFVKMSVLFS